MSCAAPADSRNFDGAPKKRGVARFWVNHNAELVDYLFRVSFLGFVIVPSSKYFVLRDKSAPPMLGRDARIHKVDVLTIETYGHDVVAVVLVVAIVVVGIPVCLNGANHRFP